MWEKYICICIIDFCNTLLLCSAAHHGALFLQVEAFHIFFSSNIECNAMNLPLSTAYAEPHKFYKICFHLILFKVFLKNKWRHLPWSMSLQNALSYLEILRDVSRFLPVVQFYLNSTVVWGHILYYFFSCQCVELSFKAHLTCREFYVSFRRKCIISMWNVEYYKVPITSYWLSIL